ncbi:CHASE2 and HATPase_c domain-containing protein [Erythrobacter sp. SDW2]|uniref:CHASE2 and HATPase_c domain-containing protein n=1 Tax=Erythrobacter sp. SDW2 TaxID=2907154 RepID=UPI001F319D18|nr:CHASE2 and HATPase_c domain-containing protein [Erythrobacter sp. SDW2]UIP06876.1 CHASE2 and HATPase_c domain-containing protein [Erythrobacter sp. SDW2]
MNPLRLRLEWLLLLLLAFTGAVAGQWTEATLRLDNRLLDFASSLARPEVNPGILIVGIDDRALSEVGSWPWPRLEHARLVDALDAAGAKLVLLDVLFMETTDPANDHALAQAIGRSGKVVLPHGFGIAANTVGDYQPVMPLPELAEAARGVGHVGALPDEDGVLRRFTLRQRVGKAHMPHLSVVALRALGLDLPPAPPQLGPDANHPIIAFNPPGSFASISAADVLAGRVPAGLLQGKIVLVGATSAGMGDSYAAAAGTVELVPGVETQANLLNDLIAGKVIYPYREAVQTFVAAISLMALFLAFWFLPPRYGLICAGAVIVILTAVSILLVPLAGRWLPIGSLLVVILLAYPLWSWRRLTAVSNYLDREARRLEGKEAGADVEGVDFIARQVSRMRRLVHNVQDSLAFLRQVIEAAPDAILVLDRNGTAQMMNAQAHALFPHWQGDTASGLGKLLEGAAARYDQSRGEIATADGKTFLVARAPLGRSGEGEIIALREVTENRRREEERKQMLEFLSHDMRTPQVAIIGLTRQGEAAPPDMLDRIRTQAERTLKLADNFVQLARLEETELKREETDLGALVEEACDRFYAQARARKIAIAQSVPEEPLFAPVDAAMIARMLDNLLSNAIKYAPEGSSVSVALAQCADGFAVLSISDQGPGLPGARMADPFARFGAQERKQAAGTGPRAGLGLAFVKRVADAHQGTVEVMSGAGQGTRFAISLPLSEPIA